MIDINNSQNYDQQSFNELLAEEVKKHQNLFVGASGLRNVTTADMLLGGFQYSPATGTSGLSGLATFGSLFGGSPPAPATRNLSLSDLAILNSLLRQPQSQPGYREALEKAKTELTDPIAFMHQNYPGQALWRFVLTHPDLDHMRGIKCLYENIGFHNFWDTTHTKELFDFRSDDDKEDWEFYQQLRTGAFGIYPRFYTQGDQHYAFARDEYGNPGGDCIEILSPTPSLVRSCNASKKSNDLSLVLRLWHAGKSILLPGDAEEEAWDTMVSLYGDRLKSDFLKASHHGRDSGYHLAAVQRIAPLITFVSVGRKPDTDASSKYRGQCQQVASTRYHGNITLEIHDDGQFRWFVDRNA
jgi:beta-lactamase superfamily II metal-dependent hydrolase